MDIKHENNHEYSRFACFALAPQARAACQQGCLTNQNTALGDEALLNNTSVDNTAVGFNSLYSNTTGYFNTAIGYVALSQNTSGLYSHWKLGALENTAGSYNTANGSGALQVNTTGSANTAIGYVALYVQYNRWRQYGRR